MSDISSTIRINDGFSEPLQNLTKAALAARSPLKSLKEAIKEVHEETDYEEVSMESLFYVFDKTSSKIEKILKRQFKALKKQTKPLMKFLKKSIPKEMRNIEKTLERTSKSMEKYAKSIAKTVKESERLKKAQKALASVKSGIIKYGKNAVNNVKSGYNAAKNFIGDQVLSTRIAAAAHGGYGKLALDTFAEKMPRAAKYVKHDIIEAGQTAIKLGQYFGKQTLTNIKDQAQLGASLLRRYGKSMVMDKVGAFGNSAKGITGKIGGGATKVFGDMKEFMSLDRSDKIGEIISKVDYLKSKISVTAKIARAELKFIFDVGKIYARGMFDLIKTFSKDVFTLTKGKLLERFNTAKDFALKEFNIAKDFALKNFNVAKDFATKNFNVAKDFALKEFNIVKDFAVKKGKAAFEIGKKFFLKQYDIIKKKGFSWYINDLTKGPKGKGIVGFFRRNVYDSRKGIVDRAKDVKNYAINKAGQVKKFVSKDISKFGKYIRKNDWKTISNDFVNATAKGIGKGFSKIANSGPAKFFGGFAKDFGKMFGAQILSNVFLKAASKLKDKMLDAGHALVDAINNSLDELTLSDKFSAMYGEAGKGAQARAYELANELGESAGMVGEMSMRAAKEGIGTDQFEQIMRLSDRISSLSIGTTTGDVANDLMANIKSNHDAGSLAQMLGGGEMMERKIRRSGYERALNRGDVNKALEIAEQIAKEAGFTDEKYKEASESMSQNFQGIMNHVDNIKKRLGEAYVEGLAPVVKRIKEIMDSPKFKRIIDVLHFGVQKIGEIINKIMMKVLGNTKALGVMFGVGVALKIWLCAVHLKQTVGLIGLIMKLGRILGNTVLGKIIRKLIVELGLRKAIAKMAKAALKGGLIIGAIALAAKILHNIFGKGKSFMDFLKGALLGVVQIIMNVFTNIKVFYDRVKGFFAIGFGLLHKKIVKGIHWLKKTLLDVFSDVIYKVVDLVSDSVIGDILERTLDIDMEDAADDLVDKLADFVNIEDTEEKLAQIDNTIKSIEEGLPEYIGWTEGFEESIKTNGQSVIDKLDKMIPNLSDIAKKATGIAGDTNKIRKTNEQEEELRWMKAFSDRQISSAYNQTVSQVHNMTVNGAPQTMMAHVRQFYINAHATNYRRLH